jgi:hypothetical protein
MLAPPPMPAVMQAAVIGIYGFGGTGRRRADQEF